MIILGIDPGTLVTGYGLVDSRNGGVEIITCGAIVSDSRSVMPRRLKLMYEQITETIDRFRPDECAVETAFYGRNAQSALKLGQSRGIVLLASAMHGIPAHEYSPREVKKAIVGSGNASKEQVQYMVKALLRMKELPRKYDVTDALAVAVCHIHRRLMNPGSHYRSWKAFITDHPETVATTRRR